MGQAEFTTESVRLAHTAIAQGWQVTSTDKVLKFVAPTGHVTFSALRTVPDFAERSIAALKSRLTLDGLAL